MTVDIFKTTTLDGFTVELISAVERNDATITLPGLIKAQLSKTLPTIQAFAIYNNVAVMTYSELRKKLDI